MSAEQKKEYVREGADLVRQTINRELLRAVYSPDQLKEQMVWFWLNQFNVFARKGAEPWLVSDYAEHAIRPHAMGKFRDLVMATLTHPAMLVYLDNVRNAKDHANENYARELMELQTLGVDARLHAEGRAGTRAHPHRRERGVRAAQRAPRPIRAGAARQNGRGVLSGAPRFRQQDAARPDAFAAADSRKSRKRSICS